MSECIKVSPITREEHEAIKCLSAGNATEYQQQLFLSLIVKKFSRANDLTFIPGEPESSSAFLAGRSFVGKQIQKYINLPVENDNKVRKIQ